MGLSWVPASDFVEAAAPFASGGDRESCHRRCREAALLRGGGRRVELRRSGRLDHLARLRDHEGMHRAGYVLHRLLADVAKADRHLVDHLLLHGARDADAAGSGERLQARRDIDAVAEEIALALDDIAERHPDAEDHLPLRLEARIAGLQRFLDVHRGPHRLDGRIELGKNRVAGRVEDAPPPPTHEIREDLAVFHEAMQRPVLVLGDEPAIADDIGRHDHRDLASQSRFVHAAAINC
jgi:hypothetical protein